MNVLPPPPCRWPFASAFAFSQIKIIFKLTIDISMREIILEMEYFMYSMIYQN